MNNIMEEKISKENEIEQSNEKTNGIDINKVNCPVLSDVRSGGDLQIGDRKTNENIKGSHNYIDKSVKEICDRSYSKIDSSDFSNGGAFVGNHSSYSKVDNNILFKDPLTASAYAAKQGQYDLKKYKKIQN